MRFEEMRRHEPAAAYFNITLPDVLQWTPEDPWLYTVTFTLLDKNGSEVDFESCRVGFRHVVVENGIVTLNGRRLMAASSSRPQPIWIGTCHTCHGSAWNSR